MTREEAIEKLQKQKAEYLEEWVDYSGVAEAYDMAISALQGGDAKMQSIAKTPDYMQQSRHDDGRITTVTLNSPISIQADMVLVVRCKDCRHADECHKSVQYTRCEPNTVTIGYTKIDFCSHGERREE